MATAVKKTKAEPILSRAQRHQSAVRSAEAKARQAVIDEYGQLDAELAPAKARMKRFDELAKTIRGWHETSVPGLTVIERGEKFQVVVGPKALATLLAPSRAIYDALGHERFLGIAKVTLGALEGEATPEQLAQLTNKERTGSRSLKAIPAA